MCSTPRIDSHQHFWLLERGDYDWLAPELEVLYRDFGPADLRPLLDTCGIEGSVVVQAAPTLAETRFLLDTARATDWIAGVVGWVDLERTEAVEQLEKLRAQEPGLCGIRPMIQDIPDPDWMLCREIEPALRSIADLGLCLDALVRPEHLANLRVFLDRHPDLRVVIDHGAKPEIHSGKIKAWSHDIDAIARNSNASCKLSGLVTEAHADWNTAQLGPYAEHLLDCFGPRRLLWGSDWPVVNLAGGYAEWWNATLDLLDTLSTRERAAVLGGNAVDFYRLVDRRNS
ncbi:MAG: amidohydrolase family protein [bacterium]|nr:amidohydrolase family protein [bacterium]